MQLRSVSCWSQKGKFGDGDDNVAGNGEQQLWAEQGMFKILSVPQTVLGAKLKSLLFTPPLDALSAHCFYMAPGLLCGIFIKNKLPWNMQHDAIMK